MVDPELEEDIVEMDLLEAECKNRILFQMVQGTPQ